jgi:hypothetical protein
VVALLSGSDAAGAEARLLAADGSVRDALAGRP